MANKTTSSVVIRFRADKKLKTRLDEAAKKRFAKPSELVRNALVELLNRETEPS